MPYYNSLPSVRTLRKLAEWIGPFPMRRSRLIISAERYGFDDNVIQFLLLFRRDAVFHNRDNFLERALRLRATVRKKQVAATRSNNPLSKLYLLHLLLQTISISRRKAHNAALHVKTRKHPLIPLSHGQ